MSREAKTTLSFFRKRYDFSSRNKVDKRLTIEISSGHSCHLPSLVHHTSVVVVSILNTNISSELPHKTMELSALVQLLDHIMS